MITSERITDAFSRQAHYFNTFAGTPVGCAAALAVLEVIEEQDLVANALNTGDHLIAELRNLAANHDMIGDIRGSGLFIGVELVRERDELEPAVEETARAVNLLRERGVLIHSTGVFDNVLKIRPPLVFEKTHAELLLQKLGDVLDEISRPGPRNG